MLVGVMDMIVAGTSRSLCYPQLLFYRVDKQSEHEESMKSIVLDFHPDFLVADFG
jgi:hypothetical protein